MTIEIYKFIKPPEHPDPSHMTSVAKRVYMATEFVITKPEYLIPAEARVYNTHLYYFEDKVVDYDFLSKQARPFLGTSSHDSLMLVEAWGDHGDDGHTDYYLVGWRYVPWSRLNEELTGHEWHRSGGLPTCMHSGWDYPERYKNLCEMIYKYENNLPPHNKE